MSFAAKLQPFLDAAAREGKIDTNTAASLVEFAGRDDTQQRVSILATVFAILGGCVVAVGVVLIVSANWAAIPVWLKLGFLLVALAASHGTGLWIGASGRPLSKTAEALHIVGAGLFLAGEGLVSQIYHLQGHLPDAVLWWLFAIVPLALLLRSASLTAIATTGAIVWLHMEGFDRGSLLYLPPWSSGSWLAMEAGVGLALVCGGAALRRRQESIARVFSVLGFLLLAWTAYMLCFYRHLSGNLSAYHEHDYSLVLPLGCLACGMVSLLATGKKLAPESAGNRWALVLLLALLLALAGLGVAFDLEWLPRGEAISVLEFGWQTSYDAAEWFVSIAAWCLWFGLCFWCISYGAHTLRARWINVGTLGVGLGVVSRFVDLMGSLATTGFVFVAGGLFLLACGWGLEKWRRTIVARWRTAT